MTRPSAGFFYAVCRDCRASGARLAVTGGLLVLGQHGGPERDEQDWNDILSNPTNVAELLHEEVLAEMGEKCVEGYTKDKQSPQRYT